MSQSFDPYRQWLGVESNSETPSYYELLGLRPLESDMSKINAAYQRQSGRIAAQFSGGQADLAQRLAGELADARMTLLTPTAKRAYDQAIAARGSVAAAGPALDRPLSGPGADQLPPTATPQSTAAPLPMSAAQPFGPQQAPYAAAPYAAQPYGSTPGYHAAPAYVPAQAYPAAPIYPGPQAYPAWQGQQPMAPAAGYYAAGAAGVASSPQAEDAAMPAVRRRPVRRRSSSAPALTGVAVTVIVVMAGLWYYFKGHETVVVVAPKQASEQAGHSERRPDAPPSPRRQQSNQPARDGAVGDSPNLKPKKVSPPIVVDPDSTSPKPSADRVMPAPETDRPDTDKAMPEVAKPQPDKPEAEKPLPDKPNDGPTPTQRNASAEELAEVGEILKSARAALANREISRAQDLLAEATIAASSPDTLAEAARVETLTSYVEMFWDAVRKTLPKIELEEIDLEGTMFVVVEADENHLVVRVEGRNREYTWQKIPTKIAYYLANRWLAPDDPVRNLVLGAFEIVDPKGDRSRAQELLEAASAAKLNAQPLIEELEATGGR